MKHTDLVGINDERLRVLAPDATHQHFKGGLYRYLGLAKDADTGEHLIGKDGLPRVAYMHCYPYERECWVRDNSEFFGVMHEDRHIGPRFREIAGAMRL